jgi:predicted nucleotidyltransferase
VTDQQSVVRAIQDIVVALGDASIVAVYLLGSFVTNPEKASDVDVIVVRDRSQYLRNRDRLSLFTRELSFQFETRTGRALDHARLFVSELEASRFLDTVTAWKIWPQDGTG